ncbi:purine and uridine phosphorylase [Annulohypoxylon nitens]|nr:purine and uridine phosphorylase [Annulohypoxylon nitens]
MRPTNRSGFDIAIICALPIEAQAVDAIFDDEYKGFGKQAGDMNTYTTGRIGSHNVVLTHMPGMGKGTASSTAASLRYSFAGIKIALVVGICGGVPSSPPTEILLGDVIISDAIVQHDFGRQYPNGFKLKDTIKDNLGRPNKEIRALLSKLEIPRQLMNLERETSRHLEILQGKLGNLKKFQYPGAEQDILFEASYRHKHHRKFECEICDRCESKTDPVCERAQESSCQDLGCEGYLVCRERLSVKHPQLTIHIGTYASGDVVMKSGEARDEIARKHRVIAFEMEGAGVWDNLPCIVIKGVCDYADSHKNKKWQHYAAVTAASCTKVFLEEWDPLTDGSKFPLPFGGSQKTGLDLNHDIGQHHSLYAMSEGAIDSRTDEQQLSTLLQNTTITSKPNMNKEERYYAAELQSLISKINTTPSSSQPALYSNTHLTDIFMSSQVLTRLRKWWSDPSSELLWIQEQVGLDVESSTSKGILALAQKANIPVAAWQYIHKSSSKEDIDSCTSLNKMLFSLIEQISRNLPSEFQSFTDFSTERFRKLDGSQESIQGGVKLIQDLLQSMDRPLIVVIEGLQMIDREKDHHVQNGLRTLLEVLQHPNEGRDSGGTLVKSLLITPGQTRFLISELKLANRCETSQSRVYKEALQSSLFAKELLAYMKQ